MTFARDLVKEAGVAVVPGSSFYASGLRRCSEVRFAFCKKNLTLEQATERLFTRFS